MHKAQPINQSRTKDGKVYPKAPAGIAVPVGYVLNDEGYFVKAKDE